MDRRLIFISTLGLLLPNHSVAKGHDQKNPNIIFILADDIGYGDMGCYGATQISTPNIDRLASTGARFTNAYAPASTSSPTRYALLTGEYAWRKSVGILPADAPMTIDPANNNLMYQLKSAGYKTAIVGKWHLGLGSKDSPVDFNKTIANGLRSIGFDYSYVFPATNDRVPTIFMENDMTVGLDPKDPISVSYAKKVGNDPTGKENPELLKLKHFSGHDGTIVNGIGRIGWMSGGNSARWVDEDIVDNLLSKAVNYIENRDDTPFFLYYATHDAHEPRAPHKRFAGKSKAGIYGDVIEEFDYCVGEIVEALRKKGILENTIIIVTSDNGPMIKEGYVDGALENIGDHDPYAGLKGEKYSLYEGGTRVPFIVHWPEKIKQSFVQQQRFCYMDMLATVAGITGTEPHKGTFNDSYDASALFVKKGAKKYRDYIVTQDNSGNVAIRKGDLKLIHNWKTDKSELYDLKKDPSEKDDLINSTSVQKIKDELMRVAKNIR